MYESEEVSILTSIKFTSHQCSELLLSSFKDFKLSIIPENLFCLVVLYYFLYSLLVVIRLAIRMAGARCIGYNLAAGDTTTE